MEAKQKADELIERFSKHSFFNTNNNSMNIAYEQEENAKECALIAVEEIDKSLRTTLNHLTLNTVDRHECIKDLDFWQSVKDNLINR